MLAFSVALLPGCSKAKPKPDLDVEVFKPRLLTAPPAARVDDTERAVCEQKIRAVLEEPEVPGAPGFAARRLMILTEAKAEPVLLIDTPRFVDEPDPGIGVRSFRRLIESTVYPWDVLKRRLPRYRELPKEGRATLLRDGYLYTEDPELAYALVNLVGAEHLFEEPKIWLQRGEFIYHAARKRNRYYFTDGPNEGEEVRLLLLDRVGVGPDPVAEETLVRDLRALKYRQHFTQAAVRHITRKHIVATLRYGAYRVPTLLAAHGARVELECEVIDASVLDAIEREKAEAARRQRVVQALRSAMREQIDEQIPFDEPLHEYGHQLDGVLRRNWREAYYSNKTSFAYNGDRYQVFDRKGRPLPPQVCVDFLTDTLERVSGTWWNPKGEPPGRTAGKLDFKLDILSRAKLRRVPGFLSYAREHPEQFEVLDISPQERIELGERERMLSYLMDAWRDYQPGDIVIIRGKTPWDPSEEHYHSFFVYESDPITGTPLALVGNAGRPSVRYWEVEARRTPERSIWHRVRPRTEWLEPLLDPARPLVTEPPPISPRGNAGLHN